MPATDPRAADGAGSLDASAPPAEQQQQQEQQHWSLPVAPPPAQSLQAAMQSTLLPDSWAKAKAILNSAQLGTTSVLGSVRSTLVGVLESVKTQPKDEDKAADEAANKGFVGTLTSVVDKASNVGIDTVNSVFSFAELLTFGTYHIASSSMKFSFKAASETANIFNTIFGSTESSRALTHLVSLVQQEILLHDPAFASRSIFGNTIGAMTLTGGITKALAAYACLQVMTADRTLQARKVARLIEQTMDNEDVKNSKTAAGLATGAVSWIVGGLAAGVGIRSDAVAAPPLPPPPEQARAGIDFEGRRKRFQWQRGFKSEQEFIRAMEKVRVWNEKSSGSFYIAESSPPSPDEAAPAPTSANNRTTLRSFSDYWQQPQVPVASQQDNGTRRLSTSSVSTAESLAADASTADASEVFEDARSFLGSVTQDYEQEAHKLRLSDSHHSLHGLGGRSIGKLSQQSLREIFDLERARAAQSTHTAENIVVDNNEKNTVEEKIDDAAASVPGAGWFDYLKTWIPVNTTPAPLYNSTAIPGGFGETKVVDEYEYAVEDLNSSIIEFTLGVSTVFDKMTTIKVDENGTIHRTHRINVNTIDEIDDTSSLASSNKLITKNSSKSVPVDNASSSSLGSKHTMGMGRHFPMINLVDNLVRYSRYATAAYGSEFMTVFDVGNIRKLKAVNDTSVPMNHVAFATHVKVPVKDILTSSYADEKLLPQPKESETVEESDVEKIEPITHYISLDREAGVVVISLRGTLSLSNLIVDLKFDYVEYKGHKMHAGMLHSAQVLWNKKSNFFKSVKRALIENPTFGVVIVGHSLGGAVATLLGFEWSAPNMMPNPPTPWCTSMTSGLPPNRPIHCYSYGSPCVVDYSLSVQMKGLVTAIINNTDMIPTISVGLVRDLKTVTFHLLDPVNKGLSEKIIARTLGLKAAGRNPTEEEEDFFFGVISELRASMRNDRLYPGGIVYWVCHTKVATKETIGDGQAEVTKSHVVLRRCEDVKEICHEPVFSPFMISDHIPKSYEDCLEVLAPLAHAIATFVRQAEGKMVVLTGAGISTGSGIPDYRGPNGVYTRNKDYRPIRYQDFVGSHEFRKRYWARSFLGWNQIERAQRNSSHTSLLSMLQNGWCNAGIITQNVDGLLGSSDRDARVLELHGTLVTLHKVACVSCGHEERRVDFQKTLVQLNARFADKLAEHKNSTVAIGATTAPAVNPRTTANNNGSNPDGDTEITWNYDEFEYPSCESCGSGIYKPDVVFFGENMRPATRDRSFAMVDDATHMLVVGTSLPVFSSFRLLKRAEARGHRVAAVNLGTMRGRELVHIYADASSDDLLPAVVDILGANRENS
ncbi:NAD-dependent protein lipoamidase sirtuin-4 [Entophlyctis sp. JEL0112]|nr:NAD-dependent protein lipoamidase sirtuin-4 [Entophlyctis sp. JEL0112]